MAGSSFGELFRFTTWGESHGPAIGVVVDGVPSRISSRSPRSSIGWTGAAGTVEVHHPAPRAGPGRDPLGSVRRGHDGDLGVDADPQRGPALEGLRRDQGRLPARPRRLHLRREVRLRDYRGGGRSSAWETACRVAGRRRRPQDHGLGGQDRGLPRAGRRDAIDRDRFDAEEVERNPFWCPDPDAARRWEAQPNEVRKSACRWARWSRWWRAACRRGSANRSTTSSTPTSPRP